MSTALGWNLISLPSVPAAPASIEYLATDIVGSTRSDFTNGEQVYNWSNSYWRWSVSMPLMPESIAEQWIGFLLALQGSSNVFRLGDPRRQSPQGTISGAPVVNGANQTGYSLNLRGLTPSSTLVAGDYLQLAYRLYRCTSNVAADGSGYVTVPIWPNLRESPSDGYGIGTLYTLGLFRLSSNERRWKIDGQRLYGITFECTEVINSA